MHFSDLLQDSQGHGRHVGRTRTFVVSLDLQSCPDSYREGGLWNIELAYLSPQASRGGYDSGLAQRPASSARDIVM